MSNISLNISGKIDPRTITLYRRVLESANKLNIPLIVVGASARDIVLHHGYGAKIERATSDVDFGIEVPSWDAFHVLKQSLLRSGFKATPKEHRIISPEDIQLDLVPFGPLQDEHANIAWPPNGDWVMNVLGFQEARDNAELIRIQNKPVIDIPVATPPGMALLKLIAWLDRAADLRPKDAKDLAYLFSTYEKIPHIIERCYDNVELMENYGWDTALAGAHCLGADSNAMTTKQTHKTISQLLDGKHSKLAVEQLIDEMCEHKHRDNEYERNQSLLSAFIAGFHDNRAD